MNRAVAGMILVLLLVLAHPLEEIARGRVPPAPEANRIGAGRLVGGVLTGSFRPMLLTYLWIRADNLGGQGRYDELHQHFRTIRALYPANARAREFIGWNLAFNFKSDAPTRELAWKWAREGLDTLLETESGRNTLAYWCLAQCGQNAVNPLVPMRYAGPAWREETWWRARLREWARERFGEELSRFEVGLWALRERQGFYDKLRRATLYERLVHDDMVRDGTSKHVAEACDALRRIAQRVYDHLPLKRAFLRSIDLLQALDARDLAAMRAGPHEVRTGVALWSIGARAKDARFLVAARTILQDIDEEGFPEELALIGRWIAHLEHPDRVPRPPLPFE